MDKKRDKRVAKASLRILLSLYILIFATTAANR